MSCPGVRIVTTHGSPFNRISSGSSTASESGRSDRAPAATSTRLGSSTGSAKAGSPIHAKIHLFFRTTG